MGTHSHSAVALALATALVTTSLFFISAPTRAAEVERPSSLAFKFGYHLYPNSSFFATTQDLGGGKAEFNGPSIELFDYSYQWPSRWSLNLSLAGAYFQKVTPVVTSTPTNTSLQFSVLVHTMTVTPIYRLWGSDDIKSWKVYGGAGVGRYGMTARFDFGANDTTEFSTYTLGYHAMIGAEYRYNEHTGFLIEEKFSRARIRFSTELSRLEIDVGGHNILVGARIHF